MVDSPMLNPPKTARTFLVVHSVNAFWSFEVCAVLLEAALVSLCLKTIIILLLLPVDEPESGQLQQSIVFSLLAFE